MGAPTDAVGAGAAAVAGTTAAVGDGEAAEDPLSVGTGLGEVVGDEVAHPVAIATTTPMTSESFIGVSLCARTGAAFGCQERVSAVRNGG